MKKILVCLSLFLLLAVGCTNTMNTPTKKVEELLGKYQKMDSTVLAQLDSVISEDVNMSDEQKKEYRSLMEKQYQQSLKMSAKKKLPNIKSRGFQFVLLLFRLEMILPVRYMSIIKRKPVHTLVSILFLMNYRKRQPRKNCLH